MSTRCQIEFKHIIKYFKRKRAIIERRTIYRHSNGYPEDHCGVIADLKRFLLWNKGRNTDIEYQTANFIYWSKRWHEERYFNKDFSRIDKPIKDNPKLKWYDNQPSNCSDLHIGFGVCENDGFHGDIAYFYEVIVNVEEITEGNYTQETTILCYEINRESWDKPIKRDNLKLIKTIKLKEKEWK